MPLLLKGKDSKCIMARLLVMLLVGSHGRVEGGPEGMWWSMGSGAWPLVEYNQLLLTLAEVGTRNTSKDVFAAADIWFIRPRYVGSRPLIDTYNFMGSHHVRRKRRRVNQRRFHGIVHIVSPLFLCMGKEVLLFWQAHTLAPGSLTQLLNYIHKWKI